jgi:hypothetical protein
MVPFRHLRRRWELAEHTTQNLHLPLAIATDRQVGCRRSSA